MMAFVFPLSHFHSYNSLPILVQGQWVSSCLVLSCCLGLKHTHICLWHISRPFILDFYLWMRKMNFQSHQDVVLKHISTVLVRLVVPAGSCSCTDSSAACSPAVKAGLGCTSALPSSGWGDREVWQLVLSTSGHISYLSFFSLLWMWLWCLSLDQWRNKRQLWKSQCLWHSKTQGEAQIYDLIPWLFMLFLGLDTILPCTWSSLASAI